MTADLPVPRHVLRLCSVFEPDGDPALTPAFDPIGGMQNHTAALTRALDDLGVRQTVITSRLGAPRGVTSLGADARVVRVGLPVRYARQFWAPAAALAARRAGPVDLVHAHQGEDLAALPLATALARHHDVPLVVTLHCSVRHSVPRSGARLTALHLVGGPLETRFVRRADAVIALTDTTARALPAADHLTAVIPSGVDRALFEGAEPSPLLAAIPGPRIVYVGRLARQKDVPTLVRAFGLVRSPASLVVVGDGPDRAAVDAAVAALPPDVRARVHRIGFRPHHEVPALLAAADVLALPSVYEEMGSILVEALHAEVPVVASDVGGIPDVVVPGETGLLVRPGHPARFAAALEDLLTRPDGRAGMVAACHRRAAAYAWDHLAGRVLDVYGAALAARRCTPASAVAARSIV